MKTIILLLLSASVSAQVYIPDNVFKTYCQSNPEINTDSPRDLDITYEEAAAYYGEMNLTNISNYYAVQDLTGIEAFINITKINCYNCDLTQLDVSDCVNIEEIELSLNNLTDLNVYGLIDLTTLDIQQNSISSLDLSSNASLLTFIGYDNDMKYLDMRNGNNANMTSFVVTKNPDLCISVDDVDWSNANWSEYKDSTARFSNDCTVGIQEKETTTVRRIPFDILGRTIGNTSIYTPILQ